MFAPPEDDDVAPSAPKLPKLLNHPDRSLKPDDRNLTTPAEPDHCNMTGQNELNVRKLPAQVKPDDRNWNVPVEPDDRETTAQMEPADPQRTAAANHTSVVNKPNDQNDVVETGSPETHVAREGSPHRKRKCVRASSPGAADSWAVRLAPRRSIYESDGDEEEEEKDKETDGDRDKEKNDDEEKTKKDGKLRFTNKQDGCKEQGSGEGEVDKEQHNLGVSRPALYFID